MKRAAPVLLLVLLSACSKSASPALPTSPTVPKTETFSGTVQVGATDFHPFTLSTAGEIDVTLTAAGPPSTILVTLGLGTPSSDGSACPTQVQQLTAAGTTPQIIATASSAGTYCVAVNVVNQIDVITYTLTVAHP